MKSVDVYSFAGGFTLGVAQAGWEVIAKREDKGGFGVAAFEANMDLINPAGVEVQVASPKDWEPAYVDAVFGNPPCSGFSGLSRLITPKGVGATSERVDFRGVDASVNECMWDMVRFTARSQADVLVLESVQPAGKMGRPLMLALRQELERLTKRQWSMWHVFHDNLHVGGVSARRRYFLVLSTEPIGVVADELVPKPACPTLADAIGDLEILPLREDEQRLRRKPSAWAEELVRDDGKVAGHSILDSARTRRMAWLAENGDWAPGEVSGAVSARLPDKGRPECWDGACSTDRGTTMYAPHRWAWDKPARVLTGTGLDENVHPTQPRTFTYREAARILGYPDTWSVTPYMRPKSRQQWFGKGIPVHSGRWIADSVRRSLEHGVDSLYVGRPHEDNPQPREYVIDTKELV